MSRVAIGGIVIVVLFVSATVLSNLRPHHDARVGTTLVFSLDIDGAIRSRRLPASTDREQLFADSIAVIDERLKKFAPDDIAIRVVRGDEFEVFVPAGAATDLVNVTERVTSIGSLQFRIEVQPDDQYPEPKGRKRFGIWPGSAEQFRQYKEDEVKTWQDARDAGVYYVPGKQHYVAKIEGRDGNDADDFLVLEVPDDEHDFDGKILESPHISRNPYTGQPVVVFNIKPAYRDLFGAWTGENVKLPMAIVLNEEVIGGGRAPIIIERLTDSVQISLGALNYEDGGKRAKELVTILQCGALTIAPKFERSK